MSDEEFRKRPWLRADSRSWETRKANIRHPRVANLNAYVERISLDLGEHVPWIDPFCGGEDATVLVVQLRPGPKGAMETNFLSLANPDKAALNAITVMETAGLGYEVICPWNIVPWGGPREEKITAAMREKGEAILQELLPLFPSLKVVLLVGEEASKAKSRMQWPGHLTVLTCAHPGPIVWNQFRYRTKRQGIFDAYSKASTLAY